MVGSDKGIINGILCASLVLLISACGQSSLRVPDEDADGMGQGNIAALPSLPQSRGSMALSDEVRLGRETFQRSANAVDNGDALDLPSTAGELAWGIWAFDAAGRDLTSLSYDFTLAAGQEVWIAIADYSAMRWEIHGPLTDDEQFPLDDALHKAPDESVFCAAITSGGMAAAVDTITLTADTGDNMPPEANLVANPETGPQPLEVAFDGSASSDSDGFIASFQWDFNDNGAFNEPGPEEDNQNNPWVDRTFDSPGQYSIRLRITDDGGLTDTATVTITVTPPNQPPTADIQAAPTSGTTPLLVSFDGSESYDPNGGSIADFEWDFDGDDTFSEAGEEAAAQGDPTPQFTYNSAGTFNAGLRVTDDGGLTDEATVTITVDGNEPPVADIQAAPGEGDPPLPVSFDASGSSDPDGSIANYEWDLDGDGVFGETGPEADAAGNDTAAFTYDSPGVHMATVRVTDDDNATDEAAASVKAFGWVQVTLAAGEYYVGTSLAIVDGRPAVAFGSSGDVIGYALSATAHGANPADWQVISVDSGTMSWKNELRLVDGKPAIAYRHGGAEEIRLALSASLDGASPADWTSVAVDSGKDFAGGPSLAVIGGKPALAYSDAGTGAGDGNLWYARSATAAGGSAGDWSTLAIGTAVGYDDDCSIQAVDGKPGIVFRSDDVEGEQFFFSSTTEGTGLGDWDSILVDGTEAGTHISLALIGGKPAIGYTDWEGLVHFALSSTAGGTEVGDWINVTVDMTNHSTWGLALAPISGRPAVAYFDFDNAVLRFAESSTATGLDTDDWSVEAADDSDYCGEECALAEVQGCPAISYFFDGLEQPELRYAIRIQ